MTTFADFDICAFNSNPLNAPIDNAEGFLQRINANECASSIQAFFENPSTLIVNEQRNASVHSGGQLQVNEQEYQKIKDFISYEEKTNKIKLPLCFEYLLTPKNIVANSFNGHSRVALIDMIKKRDEGNVIHSNGVKSICDIYVICSSKAERKLDFTLEFKTIIPKGFTKDDIDEHNIKMSDEYAYNKNINKYNLTCINSPLSECSRKLRKVEWCFNVIQKEFKILQKEKRSYYSKYFTSQPFFAFEECGIEVLSKNNRGSMYGLKQSLLNNGFKMKDVGGSKKNDLIKFLMKIDYHATKQNIKNIDKQIASEGMIKMEKAIFSVLESCNYPLERYDEFLHYDDDLQDVFEKYGLSIDDNRERIGRIFKKVQNNVSIRFEYYIQQKKKQLKKCSK